MSEHQAEADTPDPTPVADPSTDVANSTNSGTNTALDDWHASVAALDLDESPEPEQGEQPATEEAEEPQENAEQSDESEEQEQISEEEEAEPEPESRDSMRPRLKDPLDIAVAQLAKAKGISLIEASRIIDGAQATTKHQDSTQEQSSTQVETVDSVQARLEELEDMEATASSALEFETANEHRKEANKLRNKLMDLKIAQVQEQSRTEAEEERKFYDDYAKSEEKAVGLYPDAAVKDSPLAKEMAKLEAEMLELGDPLYHSTDKPFILAREAAKTLGIPMKKPGTAPVKKSVQHRPMQPAGGNARTTTTDSAQKASEAFDGIGSLRDWRETVSSL